MKSYLTIISIIIFTAISSISFAYEIKTALLLNSNNEVEKQLTMTCKESDVLCLQTCQDQKKCVLPETFCEDCATQKSQVFSMLFTDIESILKTNIVFIDQTVVAEFFKQKKFMTVRYDSFLNYLNPEKKMEIKSKLESLCYVSVHEAYVLTTLDDNNNLNDIVGVFCQDKTNQTVLLPTFFNPLFSKKSMDFWNEFSGAKNPPLILKMDETGPSVWK